MTLRPFSILAPPVAKHRRHLSIALAAGVGAQLIGIPFPFLTRSMIHTVAKASRHAGDALLVDPERSLAMFALVMGGLVLLRSVLTWARRVQGERFAQGVLADVRINMYSHLQSLSQGYFDRRPAGRILIRFVGDANALRTFLAGTVIAAPADVLTILAVAMALAVVNVQLLMVALIPMVAMVPAMIWINPRARTWTRAVRTAQSRLCGVLTDRLSMMQTVKAAGAQSVHRTAVTELIDGTASANVARAKMDALSQAVAVGAVTASLSAVGVWGARLYLYGQITQADLLAAVWLTVLFRSPINRLVSANLNYQRARVAVDRIGALLNRPVEPGWAADLPAYVGPGRTIEFRRLGYRGEDRRWLFRRLDAVIQGPAFVAITEETGSVGAILLELLIRLRRPHKGRIRLDGRDVRTFHVGSIRQRIGWVDGDRRVVNTLAVAAAAERLSVEKRLESAWAQTTTLAPSGDLSRCIRAMHAMGHRRWAQARLPRNVRFRFAVACALLNDPPILLLEDPTRELDPTGIRQFLDWVLEAARSRLIIASTHDPRLIAAAQQIIHVSAGIRRPRKSDAPDRPSSPTRQKSVGTTIEIAAPSSVQHGTSSG